MRPVAFLLAVPALLLIIGCAKAPTEKVAAAEKAVNDARAAGAAKYLPDEFAKLEGTLTSAKNELAEQDAKFGLLRDYEKAEQSLAAVQTDAARVASETTKKKEEAKAAAVQAQQGAQEAVKNAQDLVARAPVGKDRAAVEAIKADVEGLVTSLPEIQKAIDAEDYQAAEAKAKAVQEKSQAVATEIETALAKVQKAQPKPASKKTR
ncbi:hypothetical protein [Candidatus Nitrospira bockiana]